MSWVGEERWESLERWSPVAFVIGGLGSVTVVAISLLEIVVYGQRFQAVPEWGIAIIALPTFFLTFVGLLGFYPYIADEAPRLSLGGALAAAFGGGLMVVTVVASVIVHLMGIVSFTETEQIPAFVVALLLLFLALLASFILYGIASTLTKTPSRTVGLLLLVPIVEPLFTILFDIILSVEIPGGPLGTLAVEGLALIAVGYFLRTGTEPTDNAEPAPDVTAR